MSEKSYLLAKPTNTGDLEDSTRLQRVAKLNKHSRDVIEKHWAKFVKLIHAREAFAEFLGTFVLIVIGCGSIAQSVLSEGANGQFLSINIGWFIGLTMGCYIAIGISGAHLNPAVTLAMALRGRTCWLKVIPYWIAQFLGAFLASAVVYGVYVDAVKGFKSCDAHCVTNYTGPAMCSDPNINITYNPYTPLCTGKIWATYPQPFLSIADGVWDQVFGTYMLILGIFAICDSDNSEPKVGLKPVLIGMVLFGVGIAFGFNAGFGVNPARDFGPRFFTFIAGWGKDVFNCSQCTISQFWWIPTFTPMISAPLAAFTYWFLIDAHHVKPAEIEANRKAVNIPGYEDLDKPTS